MLLHFFDVPWYPRTHRDSCHSHMLLPSNLTNNNLSLFSHSPTHPPPTNFSNPLPSLRFSLAFAHIFTHSARKSFSFSPTNYLLSTSMSPAVKIHKTSNVGRPGRWGKDQLAIIDHSVSQWHIFSVANKNVSGRNTVLTKWKKNEADRILQLPEFHPNNLPANVHHFRHSLLHMLNRLLDGRCYRSRYDHSEIH